LFDEIWQQEHPQTFHEWALIADITIEEWEILRLRGLKPRALHAVLLDALVHDMATGDAVRVNYTQPRPPWLAEFRRSVIGVLAGDVAAKLQMEEFLQQQGHSIDSLVASAFAYKMPTQVAADGLLEAAYRRRNSFYAELERVRSKARRSDGLPAKAVESPPIAPSGEPITTQTEARGDVVDDGSDSRPSPPEESVS
jgi:hypothetical protein